MPTTKRAPAASVGDVITSLPIPRNVTAVRGVLADGGDAAKKLVRRHDGWRFAFGSGRRFAADEVLAAYPAGLRVVEVAEPTTPEPEQAPDLAAAVALLCALRDGLSKLGQGALTAWSWDGETLTVTATSYPPHRNVLDGARVLANGEPRLTPDGVLVWTATGYVGDGPGVPMRVLWAPERTAGGVL